MDKKYTVVYCKGCGLEIRGAERCPRCDGVEFDTVEIDMPTLFKIENVAPYIDEQLRTANAYVRSNIPCFMCGGEHYMIWPGVRSTEDYNKVKSLFTMPRCPKEVWHRAQGAEFSKAKNLQEFLGGLKV